MARFKEQEDVLAISNPNGADATAQHTTMLEELSSEEGMLASPTGFEPMLPP
jgi:hypothetical protein